jgi:hypothetical protein
VSETDKKKTFSSKPSTRLCSPRKLCHSGPKGETCLSKKCLSFRRVSEANEAELLFASSLISPTQAEFVLKTFVIPTREQSEQRGTCYSIKRKKPSHKAINKKRLSFRPKGGTCCFQPLW